jgi:hypothetical protein
MTQQPALKPEVYEDVRSVWQRKASEDAKKKGVDVEDDALATLSQLEGWEILKEHIENLKKGLDQRLAEAVLKSLGDAQIKTDAVFAVLGKELLDSVIHRVEDSRLVVDEILDAKRRESEPA